MQITLWLFNLAMENSPFIDGLPIKNVIFQFTLFVYQRVNLHFPMVFLFPKSKPTQITCG